ncbi:uncharacterized protein BO80DRAFT_330485, partial [Aspergillus ibericus CBS 121593]
LTSSSSPATVDLPAPLTTIPAKIRLNYQNGGVGAEWMLSRIEGETRKRGALRVSLRLRYGILR